MATPSEGRALLNRAVSEKQFMADVIRFAHLRGWMVYHTLRSTGSTPGFPDLVLVRNDRVLYAELKSATGRLSSPQHGWLCQLQAAGQIAVVWRPSDWPTIEHILT